VSDGVKFERIGKHLPVFRSKAESRKKIRLCFVRLCGTATANSHQSFHAELMLFSDLAVSYLLSSNLFIQPSRASVPVRPKVSSRRIS